MSLPLENRNAQGRMPSSRRAIVRLAAVRLVTPSATLGTGSQDGVYESWGDAWAHDGRMMRKNVRADKRIIVRWPCIVLINTSTKKNQLWGVNFRSLVPLPLEHIA